MLIGWHREPPSVKSQPLQQMTPTTYSMGTVSEPSPHYTHNTCYVLLQLYLCSTFIALHRKVLKKIQLGLQKKNIKGFRQLHQAEYKNEQPLEYKRQNEKIFQVFNANWVRPQGVKFCKSLFSAYKIKKHTLFFWFCKETYCFRCSWQVCCQYISKSKT